MRTSSVQFADILVSADSGFASGENISAGVVQVRMNNVNMSGTLDWSNLRRVPTSAVRLKKYALRPGDILFNHTNSAELVGKTTLFTGFKEPVVFSNHFLRLRLDQGAADSHFITRWLNFRWQQRQFENLCIRWVNQASVRRDDLLELRLELPSLSEQQCITAQLNQADRLRRIRRYALKRTNSFLYAAFLESIGDPVANPRDWKRAAIWELGDVETGNTPPRTSPDYYGNAIEWIKSDNISPVQMRPSKAAEGLSKKGMEVGRIVETGALLLTCIAGSETSIGNVALTDRRVAFNQQINAIIPHKDVDPYFLYGLFVTAKPLIQQNTTLAMKRMITKSKLEELILIKPPLTVQQKFAALVEQVERLHRMQREALRQAEHLFQSLLYNAFRTDCDTHTESRAHDV
jgi:type I restriction enzyme, S subunit